MDTRINFTRFVDMLLDGRQQPQVVKGGRAQSARNASGLFDRVVQIIQDLLEGETAGIWQFVHFRQTLFQAELDGRKSRADTVVQFPGNGAVVVFRGLVYLACQPPDFII